MTPPPGDGSGEGPGHGSGGGPPEHAPGPLGSWRPEDATQPMERGRSGDAGGSSPSGPSGSARLPGRPRRTPESPGRGALLGSAAVHLVALVLAWLTQAAAPSDQVFLAYEVELVSPPARVEGPRTPAPEDLQVETPDPDPEPEPEEPPPPEEEEPEPTEATRPEPREETPPETEREPEPTEEARSPTPDPSATTPGEDIRIRMEGLRRDFPVYYENIIQQIQRCFRWRGEGNPRATVRFTIASDGTVDDLRVYRGSGNFSFDLEAMGAVECAGRGRFGPLPADFPWEILPIEFTFNPGGRGGAGEPEGAADPGVPDTESTRATKEPHAP